MSGKGRNLAAELAKIRQQQIATGQIKLDAAREREDKIKKQQATKKTGAPRAPRKPKQATSGAPSTNSTGAAATTTASGDWKTQLAQPQLPLGMRQKQVIDHLRQHEAPATTSEIKAAINIDISTQPDLKRALENNPKIGIDEDGRFFYRPDANVRDKSQLLDYIRKAAAPVALAEIQDAYKQVLTDVQSLKEEGVVMGLYSYDPELQCEILYPVDMKLVDMKVDGDVAALWHETDVPDDDDQLKAELVKNGFKPAPRKAPRKAVKEKRKKSRKQRELRTVTNVHLMHLLQGEAPTTLDEV